MKKLTIKKVLKKLEYIEFWIETLKVKKDYKKYYKAMKRAKKRRMRYTISINELEQYRPDEN